MIDKADRWHNGIEITGKTSPELQEAIATTWLQHFGPFKYLVIDGEKGISSKETVAFLKSFGCELIELAKSQHARMIPRKGPILRHPLPSPHETSLHVTIPCPGANLRTHGGQEKHKTRAGARLHIHWSRKKMQRWRSEIRASVVNLEVTGIG